MEVNKPDTATRILDVAERLFVEHGFEATSLRMITQQAEVNLAAVNYHFGSKDALFESVFMRRIGPFVAACLAELDALEQSGQALTAEALVLTFIKPCLMLSKDPTKGGALFVRLMSRTLVENHRLLREALNQQYSVFVQRYTSAFQAALPQFETEDIAWRMHFAFGVMFNAFAGNDVLKIFVRSQVVSARDPDMVVKHLVPFVVAGLTAPV
ncbi:MULTISPECIES: TetR/AcrR family transcriptional regulator [Vogesella]|nr:MULTISPECIES: TetR/AcrR family transcriptional regulator [Vogesella]KMJ54308.1 TetR family transcriptional regulator [Vogesella sp. EB]MCQ4144786.1 TetR/AcrR family transcriptional regulator [Vogesella sp. AC12]MDC7691090.1 TetR/AcrR family transcriptional regulator [Vogesella indigofera]MDC7696724.1 TetR/AcrR family transcriptional regulator [Vogesella indigofera]MDC7699982.1 TetR/AcrR family transcriptional regulator [Vogesella indigofera]